MNRSRFLLALIVAAVGLIGYFGMREKNPVTGETQHISLTPEQEVALGLQSAPKMAEEFGGEDPDPGARARVETIGRRVVDRSAAAGTPYKFRFQLLRDPQTVNAFALPGGPVFITRALYTRLENEAQLAGVLAHEVGHVVGRHSAEHIAKSELAQVLVGAAGVAASDERGHGREAMIAASVVSQMMELRYGRKDELEADALGVGFMSDAGYDPRALLSVMQVLERASGGGRTPDFLSTHPNPGNREEHIKEEIAKKFPGGVPGELTMGGTLAFIPDVAPRLGFLVANRVGQPQTIPMFRDPR